MRLQDYQDQTDQRDEHHGSSKTGSRSLDEDTLGKEKEQEHVQVAVAMPVNTLNKKWDIFIIWPARIISSRSHNRQR
jgi:hypothetical protein